MRIGHGFDVHIFGGTNQLILGGVFIPFDKSLLAFSDGDVVLHALMDALLGASALGDIGKVFPDTDIAFKNISSRKLLRKTWYLVQNKGYRISNIDLTIIAQAPKMLPYIQQMRTTISYDLKCHIDMINIKATSTEKLSFFGKNDGIASEAVVLLTKE